MSHYLSLIVARSLNHVIGKDGKIPWRCPPDQERFRELTMGKICIVGRKTYESVPVLRDRFCLVVGNSPVEIPMGEAVESPDAAILRARCLNLSGGHPETMVLGGSSIYDQMIPRAQRVYLSTIHRQIPDGDVFFQYDFPASSFKKTYERAIYNYAHGDHTFEIWDRDYK